MSGPNLPPTYGIPDPQEAPALGCCAYCGGEIYHGDSVYTDTPDAPGSRGSVTLHRECLMDWVRDLGEEAVARQWGFEALNP